ncbi:MAG TPA: alpha-L-arabinofuranosidase C-terminal domain-containing protein [Anaerolineae bacterium]|nr:alpha-L-arabinofuranosidase C-terminal domain-containing protein [Anaerolineae bacterium]
MIQAQIRVRAQQAIGRIDRTIYGHFVEHMGRCVYGGLWAEMLANRKFNGPDLAEFGVVSPWVSLGGGPGVTYDHDNTTFYSGDQSQMIAVRNDDGRPHGVAQGPLALRGGQSYRLRVVLRQEQLSGPVRFALEDKAGRPYVVEERCCVEGSWQRHELTLTAPVDDATARLSLTCRGTGTLWLGAASLMPEDNLAGWRRDVVEAVRALQPPLIRWPGGNFASAYHWQDGIGPRDGRPSRADVAWGALEPNDVGTGEFMALCRELGAAPYLCVNLGSGTPEEAAAWVEYCNGPEESVYGRLRAEHGHPEPYGVHYWGVGNETYGNWQHGHVDARTYARRYRAFAAAMRAVDPTIALVGVGAQPYEAPGWNDAVLEMVGRELDYLSLHHYTPGYGPGELPPDHQPNHEALYPAVVAGPERVEELLQEAQAALAQRGLAGRVRLALDEWNAWVHAHYDCGEGKPHLLRDGLYAAGMYHVMQRQCGLVAMANLAQLVNVLGAIYTTPQGLFVTPVYLANRLYAEHSGPVSLATEVESPTFAAPAAAFLPARRHARYVDAQATADDSGTRLCLAVINRHSHEPAEVQIEVEGAAVAAQGQAYQLNGPSALSGNSAARPNVVTLRALPGFQAAGRFSYTFPAHSATVLELCLTGA